MRYLGQLKVWRWVVTLALVFFFPCESSLGCSLRELLLAVWRLEGRARPGDRDEDEGWALRHEAGEIEEVKYSGGLRRELRKGHEEVDGEGVVDEAGCFLDQGGVDGLLPR